MRWTRAQEREFVGVLLAMGELFDTAVSKARGELFLRAVEDLPFDAVKQAAQTYVSSGKFFPKPVELRDLVLGNTEDRAEVAWQFLLREVRRIGYTGTPTWPDEATERAALGLFGGSWRTLCENLPGSGPELLGYRKQFCASYGASARQALTLPSTREAKAALADLKRQLAARKLPTGDL